MAASNGVQRSLGQIESKLDAMGDRLNSIDIRIGQVAHSSDKRLRKVENKVHWWSGVGMAVGAIAGAVLDGAWAVIHK